MEALSLLINSHFFYPLHYLTLDSIYLLYVPIVLVETTMPWVNYVALYPSCTIYIHKKPLHSFLSSCDSVLAVYQMIYPMGTLEPALHPIDLIECLDMYSTWDGLIPSDEVFLESLIQYDLLMDVESIVFKSNPDSLVESDPYDNRSSYVCIVESLDSPIEEQVSDSDEFDHSCRMFNSYDVEFVPIDLISYVEFIFPLEVGLIDYKSLGLEL